MNLLGNMFAFIGCQFGIAEPHWIFAALIFDYFIFGRAFGNPFSPFCAQSVARWWSKTVTSSGWRFESPAHIIDQARTGFVQGQTRSCQFERFNVEIIPSINVADGNSEAVWSAQFFAETDSLRKIES